jgi:hypothetical protein
VLPKKPRKEENSVEISPATAQVGDLRVIARLLGLLLANGRPMGEQAGTLGAIGFGASEIAELRGSTPATVRQQTYMWRKARAALRKSTRSE